MTLELDRLRSLASVIGAAEDQLAVARWTLRETAVALLRCGDATLAEITRASGVEQGELLELLDLIPPPGQATAPPRRRDRIPGTGSRPWCASARDPNIQSPARPSGRRGRDADRR